jgi:glycylpeptide N-tetradecanoyltransferase
MWQAVYTAGVVVPTPLARARYFHRSLNPKKLVDINFSSLQKNQTMARMIKLYRLPKETNIDGLRPMKKGDVSTVRTLLNNYLKKF